MKKLLLALGTDIVMDDAVAIKLAKDIQHRFRDFELRILPVGGLEIIDMLNDTDVAVIIDTMLKPDARAGDIFLFDDIKSVKTLHLQNPHDVDFFTSFRLAEETGYRMPGRLIVIGVQIARQLKASPRFSSWVQTKYGQMIEQISSIIREADC